MCSIVHFIWQSLLWMFTKYQIYHITLEGTLANLEGNFGKHGALVYEEVYTTCYCHKQRSNGGH